jgi:hypothetical protein
MAQLEGHSERINYHIVELNLDDKPVLVMMAGFSINSFTGTTSVIMRWLEELGRKFSKLIMFEYASFKDLQDIACKKRDDAKDEIQKETDENDGQIFMNHSYWEKLFLPEQELNSGVADLIHEIVTSLGLTNVHLLGKCNGAWVATLLLLKSDIYKGLYLVVPGIPFGVEKLQGLGKKRLEEISFRFGWIYQDAFKFKWGVSNQEKDRYDEMITAIQKDIVKLDYRSLMHSNGKEQHSKDYHEIFPEFIEMILR